MALIGMRPFTIGMRPFIPYAEIMNCIKMRKMIKIHISQ